MNSSVNIRIHSSEVMRVAGFGYVPSQRGDTVRCVLCRLEVSHWTHDMNPFTVHSERSPHCAFVRWVQSSNHFRASPSSTTDSISQKPTKRQKTDVELTWNEADALKKARQNTFSHWTHPKFFLSQMIEAGFSGCNVEDRVICIYCNLTCHQWDIEKDDPCEVHKTLSPNCQFVKSMSCCHSSQHSKIVPEAPSYTHYNVDPEKRLASFSTWSQHEFPPVDKLVDAGFFYDGSKITCFYCNGSFENWESNNHPIAEHVRFFPHCNYARQLCGEELYHKIQRAMKYIAGNVEIGELRNDGHRLNALDDATLLKHVAAGLDLSMSKSLLKEKTFPQSTIEHCWMDQLRLKHDSFPNNRDLYIACDVHQKQIEHIDNKKENIFIPNVSLKDIYEKRQISVLNNSNQSYHDVLESFENDLQTYKNARQTSGLQFTEDNTITIKREHSLNNWPSLKPSRRDLIKGGWIICDTEDCISKCPHCHMQYYNWKSDDNPSLIHKYLSPLCLFVLSLNPFNSNPIPIRKVHEQFTDEDIENAESRPYVGLVQTRQEFNSIVSNRQTSFDRFPHDCEINTDELAKYGFYYTSRNRIITCFYCKRRMSVSNRSSRSNQYFKQLHQFCQCRYIQQLNDRDPQPSIQQVSNKCAWCMTEDKRLLALSCRHFCLCESCGEVKRLCPICKKDVTAYAIVYPS